ncbi:MAG TPA: transporter substrate-binding domain-containing protein [Spirochaetia bacterium]|nr:transporter substrate-binding domain-containing protein [Spirochaetia bacterium]
MKNLGRIFLLGALVALSSPLAAQTVLRTEFQNTQPKFILGSDGKFSGLCLEIAALLEKKGDLRFEYPKEFVPVGRIVQDLGAGNIDAFFGFAKTPQREKDFLFVGELFTTRYQILARKGDPALAIRTIADLKASGISVLVTPGAATANYFANTVGLPTEDAPASVEVALGQLKAGNGRLFGYYDLGNEWFLDKLHFRDSLQALPVVFATDAQWLCVSRALPAAVTVRLGQALEAVKKGPEWAALMKKYFPEN